MKKLMLGVALLSGAACGQAPQRVYVGTTSTPEPSTSTSTTEVPVTTSTSEPVPEPTTTEAPVTTRAYVAPVTTRRPTTTVAAYVPPVASGGESADFWYRLATCESENGRTSDNQFQFMGGTERKVGYYYGAPYAEQRAMAQAWAAALRAEGTHPGSSAGWPECWWIAGGS